MTKYLIIHLDVFFHWDLLRNLLTVFYPSFFSHDKNRIDDIRNKRSEKSLYVWNNINFCDFKAYFLIQF